ncbi:MAG: GNAT family N-acetyltransferase [Actinobacteria bacterium]|nr:GNAT family N-acetyltransferase [Actinomycetota bacterium]MBO0834517.1 GNAT family N-acetyltransferase [Actinomycetota bacterium]
MPAWTIEQWRMREQPDELHAEIYAARAALHAEARPDDPRRPLAEEIAASRHAPAHEDGYVLVARDDSGAIAGVAPCTWEQLAGWDHLLWVEIAVLPDRRRQGLGRALADRAVEIAGERGLRMVMGRTGDNVPSGGKFCDWLGADRAMVNRENRLDLRAADRDLIDRWIADGPARAPGYRLEFVAGRTPPEFAAQVAEVLNVMNTAPRENLDVGDTPITPELLRAEEESQAAIGRERWAYYAVEEASGRFVGLTDINISPGVPDRVWVGDTGVEPGHRGHALGKWLKASITRRILAELPGVRWVITWNAGSNDAMLGINEQLGFRTAFVMTTWQIPTDQLRHRLMAATVGADTPFR